LFFSAFPVHLCPGGLAFHPFFNHDHHALVNLYYKIDEDTTKALLLFISSATGRYQTFSKTSGNDRTFGGGNYSCSHFGTYSAAAQRMYATRTGKLSFEGKKTWLPTAITIMQW